MRIPPLRRRILEKYRFLLCAIVRNRSVISSCNKNQKCYWLLVLFSSLSQIAKIRSVIYFLLSTIPNLRQIEFWSLYRNVRMWHNTFKVQTYLFWLVNTCKTNDKVRESWFSFFFFSFNNMILPPVMAKLPPVMACSIWNQSTESAHHEKMPIKFWPS